jgi:hypothetical protein
MQIGFFSLQDITVNDVEKFETKLLAFEKDGVKWDRMTIAKPLRNRIGYIIRNLTPDIITQYFVGYREPQDWLDANKLSSEKLCKLLLNNIGSQQIGQSKTGSRHMVTTFKSLTESIKSCSIVFSDSVGTVNLEKAYAQLSVIYGEVDSTELTKHSERELCKLLIDRLIPSKESMPHSTKQVAWLKTEMSLRLSEVDKTFEKTFDMLMKVSKEIHIGLEKAKEWMVYPDSLTGNTSSSTSDHTKVHSNLPSTGNSSKKPTTNNSSGMKSSGGGGGSNKPSFKKATPNEETCCHYCGFITAHDPCPIKADASRSDWNSEWDTSQTMWKNSKAGAAAKSFDFSYLSTRGPHTKKRVPRTMDQPIKKKHKRECCSLETDNLNTCHDCINFRSRSDISNHDDIKNNINSLDSANIMLLTAYIFIDNLQHKREIKCLVDTGAAKDYISLGLANYIFSIDESINNLDNDDNNNLVCSAFTGICQTSVGKCKFNLNYIDDNLNFFSFSINSIIADIAYDVIIGSTSIRKYDLVAHIPSRFLRDDHLCKMIRHYTDNIRLRVDENKTTETQLSPNNLSISNEEQISNGAMSDLINSETNVKLDRINELNTDININLVSINTDIKNTNSSRLDPYDREDISEIPLNHMEAFPAELLYENDVTSSLPNIIGEGLFKDRLIILMKKHKNRFRTTVSPTPAKVSPFELKVDETIWYSPKNMGPPRNLDKTRQDELFKQIEVLLGLGILAVSKESYHSHAFMVPKPGKKWRFVLDFKNLNNATTMEHWPIPNIKEMITRIGSYKPKYFAVMDLTSGYHQAPISLNSRKWTCFMTSRGVYEWCRLPMGLKGAPSYFQRVISQEVLQGLVGTICELYIDDIIVHASTEEQFLERLSTIFERFEKHNITLNPDKCQVGLLEVEYVGHTINSTGISFKRERLDSVVHFPLPTIQQQLKSFLGLANWFRDHIKDHSLLVKPLNDMLKRYDKRRILTWSQAEMDAFAAIKEAIHNCPQLFFMDDESPILVHTDASDYGLGAYVSQIVEGKEVPIGFVSKTFDDRMQKWDTYQKEGYAIYFALQKWDYLLRDRRFTLKTDHKNLTLLKESSDAKVVRWMTALQMYDFELEYIPGPINTVADALSRLCALSIAGTDHPHDMICALEDHWTSPKATFYLDVLQRNIVDDTMTMPKDIIAPLSDYLPTEHEELIRQVHNATVGHHKVERTVLKLSQLKRFKEICQTIGWPHLRTEIKYFIDHCATCQKNDQRKLHNHASPFTLSSYYPMKRIAMDLIEGLKPDADGNDMIIVIVDTCSRYIELIPTISTKALPIAKAICQWAGRFGVPRVIVSDRGTNFMSTIVADVIKLMGGKHEPIHAYSKEENGLVERANKEVFRHIRDILLDRELPINNWSDIIPMVQRIILSTVHSSTGFAPQEIIYGKAIDLDEGIFITYPDRDKIENISEHMSKMLNVQTSIFKKTKLALQSKDRKHLDNYSTERTEFQEGSHVTLEHRSNLRRGPKSKLLPFRRGPLQVVKQTGSHYELKNLVTNNVEQHHVTEMSQFKFDNINVDPTRIAMRDEIEPTFTLERVLRHRGDIKRKKSMSFLCKWQNFEDSENTWEPWNHVRKTLPLHEYLRNHPNKKVMDLVPEVYRIQRDADDSEESGDD